VIAQGDRITTVMSGSVVNERFRSSLTERKTLIQSEGADRTRRRTRRRAPIRRLV
jgi:hypothetical protein